ncbi:type II secretion system F family protein [Mycetocola manganoxydans]|uniref:type II secretion system F family protein n=1 Tax=Mycetocola manganoxydans TaxID=699879 RepID=UPI001989CF0C|nr:type II secretion system F family protein [Mycetocola manganoxydans]GHD48520.1 type II secretion system protein F [Mycetocola manganoxydans]
MITLTLGGLLAAGALLVVSPWLFPRRSRDAVRVRPRRDRFQAALALAGLGRVPPAVFVALSLVLGLLTGALAQAILGVGALSLCASVVGGAAPALLVAWRARTRRSANRALWPDVVDHLVGAVRSGLALPDAVVSLASNGPEALRSDFRAFEADYGRTGSFGGCLDRLKESLADPVPDRILETLRMARDVGGTDLTVVLRSLAAYLREDLAIRAEVEARQSWIRNAAKLGVAAPWCILLLLATRPEAAIAYNSSGGAVLIAGGAAVSVVAYRVMLSVGRLPQERRWFQ